MAGRGAGGGSVLPDEAVAAWISIVTALAAGASVGTTASTAVEWLQAGTFDGSLLSGAILLAAVAVLAGGYVTREHGASLSPVTSTVAMASLAVALVHLAGVLLFFLLLLFLAPLIPIDVVQGGCPECGGCEGCCDCGECAGDCAGTCGDCAGCCGGCVTDPCGCGSGCACGDAQFGGGSGGGTTGGGGGTGGSSGGGGGCGGGGGGGCDCGGGGGGDCGCGGGLIGLPGLLAGLIQGSVSIDRADLDEAWAHHPDHPDFAADVFEVGGVRLCVGCFVTYPLFVGTAATLTLAWRPDAWQPWLVGGVALSGMQALSSAGWTTTKLRKTLVKTALGLGLGALFYGVRRAPWPGAVKVCILLGAMVLAGLSAIPRSKRLAAWRDATS